MPVLGIDLGAATTVLATVGKGGVTVVRNDLAERLTPTLVSFTDKERLIGDAALTSLKANASRTCRNFKHLLGATDDSSSYLIRELERSYSLAELGTSKVSNLVGYKVGADEHVTATQVLACYLKKMKSMSEAFIGANVSNVVVAVPTWLSDAGRQAVLDACGLANLGCFRVMNHSAATALDYGLFRTAHFQADKPQYIVFVDGGYSAMTVTVAEYLPSQLRILHVQEDPTLGGRTIDRALVQHISSVFLKQTGCDTRRCRKALLKLEEACEKSKKILSANKETTIHLECFMDEKDLEYLLTREELEKLAAEDFTYKFVVLLENAIAAASVPVEQLTAVEICGGTTRIPFVQAVIEKTFGRTVSRTVSADECVARGAAIQAAMLDRRHRVREFCVIDKRNTPVRLTMNDVEAFDQVHLEEVPATTAAKVDLMRDSPNSLVLFPSGTPNFHIKWLIFPPSVIVKGDFVCSLTTVDALGGQELPLGTVKIYMSEEIRSLARELPADKGRLKIRFMVDIHGITRVNALFVHDVLESESYLEKEDVKDEEGNITNQQVQKTRQVSRTIKTELAADFIRPAGWLTAADFDHLYQVEEHMSKMDKATADARNMANDILSSCFKIRGELEGVVGQYATPQEKAKLLAKTYECESWVEENSELSLEDYTPIYQSLKESWEHIYSRKVEADLIKLKETEAAAEAARKSKEEQDKKEEEKAETGEMTDSVGQTSANMASTEGGDGETAAAAEVVVDTSAAE